MDKITMIKKDENGMYDLYTFMGFYAKVSADYLKNFSHMISDSCMDDYSRIVNGVTDIQTDIIDACFSEKRFQNFSLLYAIKDAVDSQNGSVAL